MSSKELGLVTAPPPPTMQCQTPSQIQQHHRESIRHQSISLLFGGPLLSQAAPNPSQIATQPGIMIPSSPSLPPPPMPHFRPPPLEIIFPLLPLQTTLLPLQQPSSIGIVQIHGAPQPPPPNLLPLPPPPLLLLLLHHQQRQQR